MEDVNMSQSAEQTATGNVPTDGQMAAKRQFSAESFRALTRRLNSQLANEVLPSVNHQNEPEMAGQSGSEPAIRPAAQAPAQIPDIPQVAPFVEPAIEPIIDEAVSSAPEPIVEEALQTQADELPAQDMAVPVVDDKTDELAGHQTHTPAIKMPVKATTIILSTAKNAEPLTPAQMVEQEKIKIPEIFRPDNNYDETGAEKVTAPEPVATTFDPLQAAMDLMRDSDAALSVENVASDKDVNSVPQAISQGSVNPLATDDRVLSKSIAESIVTKKPVQAPPEIGESNEVVSEIEPDAESGNTARALLDIMSSGSQPQERALAADTLLQLVPRMMEKDLIALSERVCMMADAPSLLVKALINHHEPRVASPLLEDGKTISEQDLLRLIATTDVDRLIMMAKHRAVSQTVCDALIARGEPSVYLTLLRNPGAALSHDAFVAFNEIAKTQSSLQAPLATRGDTPPPIAFELFWSLPVELRRYVLSRFLTDSTTLDKILKITKSVDSGTASEHKFPPKRKVEELIDLIADGVTDQAAKTMAELSGINQDNARRIIADPDGEPLTVILKTMGQTRAQFSQAIKKCASSSNAMLRGDRDLSELQIMFDSLSFNKARTLLTYWDWAIEKTGPYIRRAM